MKGEREERGEGDETVGAGVAGARYDLHRFSRMKDVFLLTMLAASTDRPSKKPANEAEVGDGWNRWASSDSDPPDTAFKPAVQL